MADRRVKLLLIEDNPDHVVMIQRQLAGVKDAVGDWTCYDLLTPALEHLRTQQVDIALVDLNLPDADRWRVLEEIIPAAGDAAIVVLTSLDDQDFALRAVQEGAQDYLVKSKIDGDTLSRSIRYAIERKGIERKLRESQTALRESEARIRAVFDSALDCIITIGPGESIVEFNPAAETTFGCTRDEALGKTMADIFLTPDFRQAVRCSMAEFMKTGAAPMLGRVVETEAVRLNNEPFVAEMVMQPVRVAGELLFTIFLRDITQRKAHEEKLQHYAAELERSNSDLERFTWVVAHDLAAPLNAVSGYCQLLQERYGERLDQDGREFLEWAIGGANRMYDLIQGLREYSQFSWGKKQNRQVDCAEVLRSAIDNLRVPIDESRAEITYDDMPQLHADPTQILQLFQNLISNAIKYRNAQSPRVHIGAEQVNDSYRFHVADNGIGIAQNQADRVFEIFQRGNPDDERYKGSGIGLAICKRIVERHEGQIWFESELGEGTTIYFTLPVGTESVSRASNADAADWAP